MNIFFMKAHSAGSSYIVINMADISVTDMAEVARRLCLPPLGVGADGLAVIKHLGSFRFTVWSLRSDGADSLPSSPMLRCCARAIEIRYGYQSAILVTRGNICQTYIIGQNIGLLSPEPTSSSSLYQIPEPRARRPWMQPGKVATIAGDINSPGHTAPPAAAILQRRADGDADAARLDQLHYPALSQQSSSEFASWSHEPAILLFEGEFPWP